LCLDPSEMDELRIMKPGGVLCVITATIIIQHLNILVNFIRKNFTNPLIQVHYARHL
jgi:hypothetical protein